jgi:hypothetical protein
LQAIKVMSVAREASNFIEVFLKSIKVHHKS